MTLIKSSENSYSVVRQIIQQSAQAKNEHAARSRTLWAVFKAHYEQLNDWSGRSPEKLDEITKGITGEKVLK